MLWNSVDEVLIFLLFSRKGIQAYLKTGGDKEIEVLHLFVKYINVLH